MLELQTQSNTWRSPIHSRTADDESLTIPVALNVATSPDVGVYEVAKRLFDIAGALAILVILSPLFLLIALAIKLDTPGPVIYIQKRVGKAGRAFPFYKFRSMTNGDHTAEHRQIAKQYISGQISIGQLPKPSAMLRSVTRVGRILRKTSLDELPQVFCILKGDMSFVGPRPIMAYEAEEFKDWHWQRLAVLPGLTGLAQINGRSRLDFDDIVRFDITYIATRSLRQDLTILARTVPQVLAGKDAG